MNADQGGQLPPPPPSQGSQGGFPPIQQPQPAGFGATPATPPAAPPGQGWSMPAAATPGAATPGAATPGAAATPPWLQPRVRRTRALLAGTAAAIAMAVIWAVVVGQTGFQVGLVAVFVGAAIGGIVRKYGGGYATTGIRFASAGLTLLSMAASEYLIVRHFVAEYAAESGLDLALPLVPGPVQAVTVIGASLWGDPLTLLFWGIAVVTAWRLAGESAEGAAPGGLGTPGSPGMLGS